MHPPEVKQLRMSDSEASIQEEVYSPFSPPVQSPVASEAGDAGVSRPTRQRGMPAKIAESITDKEELLCDLSSEFGVANVIAIVIKQTVHFLGAVLVQCCQTNRRHVVKIKDLSREDGDTLTMVDFKVGNTLMMMYRGKPYPVKFIEFKG